MTEESKTPRQIFTEAVAKPTAEERWRYLASACGSDGALRSRIEALLEAQKEVGDFLETPALCGNTIVEESPLSEGVGTVFGNYKLLEKIGEGGMAVVYMAQQEQPIRRKVALKIIKLGMDTKQVIARFEAERQALAMMDHPNIAKIHDAGATETGRPYFVMELVTGVPITDYCNRNQLSTKDRLGLFIEVCNAVQHAHSKNVIHRDLKPTNILVANHDGRPVPKVIDFGIAKATNQRLTEKTLFTRYAHIIGTPAYMSPEQAELSDLGVDHRSDVYSLGVLLYELLTGTPPFSEEELRHAGYLEMQRIIREEEPPKPSARLTTLGESLVDIAKRHNSTPDLLTRNIRGDLDWVVMKALEKDRMRRYEEISALAFDIRSYLEHRPIVARAPSLAYRLNKFVRRNSVNLTMALVSVIIVSAAILLFVSRYRAHIRITEAESRSHSKLLSQGHIFYRNWQYGMALEQSRAILRSPHVGEQARSLRELALAKVQEELESYCQRIKKNPEIMDNYFFRALLYRQLGEEELARSDMAQYIARVEQGGNFAVQLGTAEKLGPAINSPNLADNEWKPRVSMDGLSLSFFRNLDEDWEVWVSLRTTMQSLWNMAYRDVIGTGPKVPILGDTPSDGLEFYAWGTLPGGYGLSDILVRIRESIKDPWGETQNIGATINTHNHEKMAQVSPDGLELYFCREPAEVSRPTSQGGADLWMSRRAARNARWQEPINLGVNVNSEARDIRPHISADSLLLFFASNRPGGLGGYDLYVTQRKTPSDPWEEVINLGPRVNSPVDELYPAISPDGRMLYFSRDGDIWQASVFSIVNNSSPAAITSPGNHSGRPNQGKEVIQEKKQ